MRILFFHFFYFLNYLENIRNIIMASERKHTSIVNSKYDEAIQRLIFYSIYRGRDSKIISIICKQRKRKN